MAKIREFGRVSFSAVPEGRTVYHTVFLSFFTTPCTVRLGMGNDRMCWFRSEIIFGGALGHPCGITLETPKRFPIGVFVSTECVRLRHRTRFIGIYLFVRSRPCKRPGTA